MEISKDKNDKVAVMAEPLAKENEPRQRLRIKVIPRDDGPDMNSSTAEVITTT